MTNTISKAYFEHVFTSVERQQASEDGFSFVICWLCGQTVRVRGVESLIAHVLHYGKGSNCRPKGRKQFGFLNIKFLRELAAKGALERMGFPQLDVELGVDVEAFDGDRLIQDIPSFQRMVEDESFSCTRKFLKGLSLSIWALAIYLDPTGVLKAVTAFRFGRKCGLWICGWAQAWLRSER
ncbi:unnamed protein product [Orchesella dallaii]|uniref:Transposase n=1 Tax=Orchesella dallaii TaxID=48710 RepID=A0ABP1Q363_9HEXA